MGRRVEVPITPSVLEWAIAESGYTQPEVSSWIEGGEETLASWLDETAKPSLTEMKVVAGRLHRQLATFLLPEPPVSTGVSIQFRNPLGGPARSLNPVERRYVRRAMRIQTAHAWLLRELGHDLPALATATVNSRSTEVAEAVRASLGVTVDQQRDWRTASAAFDAWRESVEHLGVLVFLFPLGEDSCRGFSLWDDAAPLIAINTRWRDEARILTLFHELGHLVTRSNSACQLSETSTGDVTEPAERWCESFVAAILIPPARVGAMPGAPDRCWKTERGVTGRSRLELREHEFGRRGIRIFVEAVRRGVISESQMLDYCDCPISGFDRLLVRGEARHCPEICRRVFNDTGQAAFD